MYKNLNLNDMENIETVYVARSWPDYQDYMEYPWFRQESYYCADKDIYLIPKNRIEECNAIR